MKNVSSKTPSPPILSTEALHLAYNTTLSNALFYVAAGVALMYIGLSVGHALTLPDHYRAALTATSVAALLIQVSTAVYAWKSPVPPHLSHFIGTLLLATLIVNSALHLGFSAEEKHASNLALIIVSAGCFLLSLRWWFAVVVSCVLSWALISYTYVPTPDWVHYGFMCFICVSLSAIVIQVRRKNIEANEKLRIADVARLQELETALSDIKVLEGMIPICAWCKKIRDDEGFWGEVESYVSSKTRATFSHSLCPTCEEKHFGDVPRSQKRE